jgi:hypothetical protein
LRGFLPRLPLPTPPPPKPPKNRQNLPVDGRVPLWHRPPMMNVARNQFSLTREASITGAAAKEQCLISKLEPSNPEAWYDLAALKADIGKPAESLVPLKKALELSAQRLKRNPKDDRFTAVRHHPRSVNNRRAGEKAISYQNKKLEEKRQ